MSIICLFHNSKLPLLKGVLHPCPIATADCRLHDLPILHRSIFGFHPNMENLPVEALSAIAAFAAPHRDDFDDFVRRLVRLGIITNMLGNGLTHAQTISTELFMFLTLITIVRQQMQARSPELDNSVMRLRIAAGNTRNEPARIMIAGLSGTLNDQRFPTLALASSWAILHHIEGLRTLAESQISTARASLLEIHELRESTYHLCIEMSVQASAVLSVSRRARSAWHEYMQTFLHRYLTGQFALLGRAFTPPQPPQ